MRCSAGNTSGVIVRNRRAAAMPAAHRSMVRPASSRAAAAATARHGPVVMAIAAAIASPTIASDISTGCDIMPVRDTVSPWKRAGCFETRSMRP